MTIWLLTILVLGSTIGLGYRQGWIRAAFSFLGIVFATLLALPIGHLFKPLLKHVGAENETMAWMIAPIVAFPVVLVIFKIVGSKLHHKSEMHYKHKAGELELSIWTRLNHRLGACIGVLNGSAYVILLCFIIFNFSYWTVQVAGSEAETNTTRLINRLGKDSQSTGMAQTAGSVGTMPDDYYRLANLAGLICQNPAVSARLARYPMFVSLLERDDLQQLANDNDFTNAWATHAPMGQILNEPSVQNILKNNDLLNTVWGVVEPNLEDLETYIKTGKSPKYDGEPVLGFWDMDVRISFAYLRLTQPEKISPAEIAASRGWMYQNYSQTMLIAAGDNQAFMKFWPDLKNKPEPGQPPVTVNWKGTWSKTGNNYQFTFNDGSESRTFATSITGGRLMLKDAKNTFVFNHEP